jgi:hypothetical protein
MASRFGLQKPCDDEQTQEYATDGEAANALGDAPRPLKPVHFGPCLAHNTE